MIKKLMSTLKITLIDLIISKAINLKHNLLLNINILYMITKTIIHKNK